MEFPVTAFIISCVAVFACQPNNASDEELRLKANQLAEKFIIIDGHIPPGLMFQFCY